jgi:signal transduction histidine kinase/ActR/RegA family two-component response regulator
VARRFELRYRIGLLVLIGGLGLITVTAVTLILGRRGEEQLAGIETRYVPLSEVDRDLDTLFAEIPRALGDAASAADESRLADADGLADQFVTRLRGGRDAIVANGGDPDALEAEFRAYFTVARQISASMMAETPTADLGDQIEAMGQAKAAFAEHLDLATTPDRSRLAAAFATAHASQRNTLVITAIVAAGVLVLMAFVSWQLSRRTVGALRAVSRGVERLAEGEYGEPIDVASRDELGDLAREANRTALRLREYRERSETLLAETKRQAEDLARASRYKSEFLANMSHELRTPLNSILLLSQMLATNSDGTLTAKQAEYASVIRRSGEELLGLINEVLDLAKVEAGKQSLEVRKIAPGDLADYVRKMFEPLAAQKQLELVVTVVADAPKEIRTDWARLTQIVKNLVANAIKFTEKGGVSVQIAASYGDRVEIAVADTGIGIARDKQAWIFEAFAQAESGTSRKYGGTGLGLTIAKQLAIRLGGDLSVESAVSMGSTFRLLLPVGGPPADAVAAARRETLAPPLAPARAEPIGRPPTVPLPPVTDGSVRTRTVLAGKTVLIVDDDMRNVYSLSSALHRYEVATLAATDGQEALDELARKGADLVLMDIMMPGLDGYETTRRIRELPKHRELPIIALTARTGPGEREKCISAGASDYLPKPVDLEQLLAMMRSLLAPAQGGDAGIVK